MKFLLTFLCGALLVPAESFAAQIQGSEITLCTRGYSAYSADTNSVSCVPYDVDNCSTGYLEYPYPETFTGMYNNKCQLVTYKTYNVPDTIIDLKYSGLIVGNEINLCTNGYSPNNTSCTTYGANDCESGYREFTNNRDTFVGIYNNNCALSTYIKRDVPETSIVLSYHGTTSGSELTLCNGGYSTNNSTCTTYGSGACPSNYYDLNLNSTVFSAKTSGSCTSGYSVRQIQEYCGYDLQSESCVDLCMDGRLNTSVGTCGTLCELGATTLRTSTGLVIPMWSEKQITPSINIGFNNGVCYVNLESGTTTDAIHMSYGGATYHTTK